jgi:hypothetical protein
MKYILICLVLLTGCGETVKNYPKEQYKTIVACVVVRNHMVNPAEVINTTKYKRSECPECKGTGILKTGDGLGQTVCPYCVADNTPEPVKPSHPRIFPNLFGENDGKCCQDCICGENCQCTYPAQCLIEKNLGWPVTVCDENECRTYYPHDSNGEKYNPYDLIPTSQRKEYQGYETPIKIDAEGNRLKTSGTIKTYNIYCRSCRR